MFALIFGNDVGLSINSVPGVVDLESDVEILFSDGGQMRKEDGPLRASSSSFFNTQVSSG